MKRGVPNMADKLHLSIAPGATQVAAEKLAKVARENLPVLYQGDEVLMVELPVFKDCSNCRWGDWAELLKKHLCWGLETIDAEICRANNHSNWEPKRKGGRDGCD